MARDGRSEGAPSEAEMQQMLAQMREAPAEQVLVEVVNALLQAVQVKLGRADARLLLDVVAATTDAVRGRADEQLVAQVTDAVTQLRLAQVEAEGGAQGAVGESGSGAPDTAAGPPQAARPPQPAQPAQQGQPGGGSRLWVPGS